LGIGCAIMVLPIVCYPANVLRVRCNPVAEVTADLRQLAENMLETMHDARGVGLAAPQISKDIQLAVIDVSHNPRCVSFFRVDGQDADMVAHMPIVFINPKVEPLGKDRATDEEGCLSMPDLRGKVTRPAAVKVTYQTLDGTQHTVETDGLLARAFQHEIDHLNGILFVDRFSQVGKMSLKRKLAELMPEWRLRNLSVAKGEVPKGQSAESGEQDEE
jgi:peptide deformylase